MDLSNLRKQPVNIDLIEVTEKDISRLGLGKVTEGQIFEQNSNIFHRNGLFSTEIFGNVGTEARNRTFGYIDLNCEILHPIVYYAIITLKSFYKQIMEGSLLAEWDPKTSSFVKSNSDKAQTGYEFFFSHVDELKFDDNGIDKRKFYINLYNKAISEGKYKLRYHLVLPAGIRDYTVDENGKPQEDEINPFYRKLIFQSALIDYVVYKKSPEVFDSIRNSLQTTSLDIFNYLESLLEGKHKLILGKWLTRKIFNSTRNVLANYIEKADNINDPNRMLYNNTYVGLHQFVRSLAPKTIYEIKNFTRDIFVENNTFAYLTNAKTLRKEEVLSTHIQKDYDQFTTYDGIEKLIANFGNLDLRHLPITLNKGKHYLGLIYNDGKYVKFFQDIEELPSNLSRDHVSPITLAEFLYLSVYKLSDKYPMLVTRYPITGYGSIYPSIVKVQTTVSFSKLEELDFEWKPSGNIIPCFPKRGLEFFNAMSANISHYAALGADIDGDTLSGIAVTTDEAIEEIYNYLKKKEYYVSSDGMFYFSISSETLDAVLSFMTA